ncbi:hypothetical protein AB6E06_22830 [Vibrio splendidus]
MPLIPIIYSMLAAFFAQGLLKIIVKAGLILGMGTVSYLFSDALLTNFFNHTYAEFQALDTALFQLLIVMGVTEMINYLVAYIMTLITIIVVNKIL